MAGSIVLVCLCFLVKASAGGAENLTAPSKISHVTVYPGSARVTRQAEVNLSPGEHSVILDQIIPHLDENSLTVTGRGAAAVKIFGAYLKREHTKETADQRVQDLEEQIERLSDELQKESQSLEILRKETEYLDSIKLFSGQQIPKDLVTSMPSVENLEGVRGFLSSHYADVESKKEAGRVRMRDLQREQQVAQLKLNELRSSGSQQQRQLVVDLECAKAGKFTLEVSYLVYGATWRSLYDARADFNKKEVELTAFGAIKQTTGEDWEDVQLTLSTARPIVSGRMPDVMPWILQPYQPPMPAQRAARMRDKGGMQESSYEPYYLTTNYAVRRSADAPAAMEEEAQLAYSQVEQKGVSVVYNIARPATVKSDGTENKYPVSSQALKADFEYSTFPMAIPSAFLGSKVVNAPDLQLLAGEVNLFLEGDYVGKSGIDNIGPGEEFQLYLGIDENVKVKREQISRKVDDILLGGIKSPNRKTTFEYKLTVENYKADAVKVNVFEAMPVAQNEQIKVKVMDVKPNPKDKDWKDRQGIWRWEFTLNPKEKQEILYSFSVEHPRDFNIPGI
ncbi:MAG: hypothetical protein A3C36_02830 [Omnitrophica WOR_2 bacterium RIFCSPHIGHO2_02_FULL_52_10]|nr:MAG: hypothetical protein A3C36_02830 [Omnitrophica WOR_2 bacterium RIFCSPHIGHO2_02_FULL_52_10]